jgi:hypothetical protein
MSENKWQDIRDSYSRMDIFSLASTEAADFDVASRTGDAGITDDDSDELSNGDSAPVPLADAISMAQLSQVPEFRMILARWQEMVVDFTRKSKDERLTQDARTFNHNKSVGIEQALAAAGEIILAAQERLKSASSDERALMGNDAQQLIGKLAAAPIVETHDNRDALITSSLPKFRVENPEDARRKTREMIDFFEKNSPQGKS